MKFLSLSFLFVIWSNHALAQSNQYCLLKPKDLGTAATHLSKNHQKKGLNFPSTLVIQSNAAGTISNIESQVLSEMTYEAFLRVERDGQFSLLPLPLFTVDLSKERDVLYVCTHTEGDGAKLFVEIYFLKGYRLGDTSVDTVFGDILFNSVKVSPVSINPIGFNKVENVFQFENTIKNDFSIINAILSPLRIPFDIADQIQSALMATLNKVLPFGVERIHVDRHRIILYSGVNLESPDEAIYKHVILLGQE